MNEQAHTAESLPEPDKPGTAECRDLTATVAPAPAPVGPGTAGAASPAKLTPEEQMELFARELKNNDWGHQPN